MTLVNDKEDGMATVNILFAVPVSRVKGLLVRSAKTRLSRFLTSLEVVGFEAEEP
jgi:hypothetical protein